MKPREIVIISGKGGTGKTTVTASLIPFLKNVVISDCDVDAPDLDILLKPEIRSKEDFIATTKAVISTPKCTNCGKCSGYCRFSAIKVEKRQHVVKNVLCEGCGVCELVCPAKAICLTPYKTGELFDSKTEYGDMIHGRLTPGEEVSGRLISEVRKRAKNRAEEVGADTIIIDGPPGIACNVISSITGSSLAIIVTEPTVSGLHDLKRVHETVAKLAVACGVIINRSTLSEKYAAEIKSYCNEYELKLFGEIPLDKNILKSVNRRQIPDLSQYIHGIV